MNYILFDDSSRPHLLPFTHTRPVADIRCGILTMRERWEMCLLKAGYVQGAVFGQARALAKGPVTTGTLTEPYLQPVFPANPVKDNVYINGAVFGTIALADAIFQLEPGQALAKGYYIIAARLPENDMGIADFKEHILTLPSQHYEGEIHSLKNLWDIFTANDRAIKEDFELITKDRNSAPVPDGVTVTGRQNLFMEAGATICAGSIINATTGPVYIAKDAEILEGVMIRGPLAVGSQAVIKMGAKIYGATTIGPGCKVGGEINNVIFFANSNKAHDGYLGNAVIGEWCNLGADTNCSNLKNNYAEVKIWDEAANRSVFTGLTFCGLLMGDHSKCGINTMFNTGTIVGVSCNIFGGGFPEKFIPSFSWGVAEGTKLYDFNRAMETAGRMMARRGKKLSEEDLAMYRHIFDSRR